jgi:predicted metal-dependent hydrolase
MLAAVQLGLPFESDGFPRFPESPRLPGAARSTAPLPPTLAGRPPLLDACYFVRHRRARRYVLRVDPDGRVRVTIPRGGSKREAETFAARNRRWIERQRARLAVTPAVPAEEGRAARERARRELPPRLLVLAAQHGLAVTRISVRNQRTRWGSCGREGHICLNWRLVLMPDWVADYVMVHELMHLRRLDHSPAYWRLVAAAYPRFREARLWLRLHGPSLR